MTKNNPCPCPNLDCPNHGNCENCSSRHLKKGTLNYCGFYAILPKLEEAVKLAPDSKTAIQLNHLIEKQMASYNALIEQHNLSDESQDEIREKKAEFSDH